MTDFVYDNTIFEHVEDPFTYSNNRLIFLAAMNQATLDVTRGIGDSGQSNEQRPRIRAGALAYFVGGGYDQVLMYCGVRVNGARYPDEVTPWVQAMATWCKGELLCPVQVTDEEIILWAVGAGVLDEPEPWDEAVVYHIMIQMEV